LAQSLCGVALSVNSSFDDDFINRHIPYDVIFDDAFGFSIYPEKVVFPNEKDYDMFLSE